MALAVLIYTFGPRDLDIDVRDVIHAETDEEQMQALEILLGAPVPEDEDVCRTAAINAVFCNAQKRWFGVIFWFAVFGIYGALLYRLASRLSDCEVKSRGSSNKYQWIRCKIQWRCPCISDFICLSYSSRTHIDSTEISIISR